LNGQPKVVAVVSQGTDGRRSDGVLQDRIEVWCDWDPVASDLEEIVENIRTGDAVCTKRQVVDTVDRPQDIEDEDAMSFFGGDEGDADLSQG